MDGTILSQGSFIAPATIVNQLIKIPSNADFMWVYNYTQAGAAGVAAPGSVGFKFYWQRGMPFGGGLVSYKQAPGNATAEDTFLAPAPGLLSTSGFVLYDPSGQSAGALPLLGLAVATTATTNATQPVVSTANTAGIVVGSVVRLNSTAQTDINGIDFVVGAVTPGVSFTLLNAGNALATAPGVVGGAGFYRLVNVDPLFYPRMRTITNITQAQFANVSTSTAHGMTPGQKVRFHIPKLATGAAGMTQLDEVAGIVLTVVDDFNFTVNIDTTNFTAFVWPTAAQSPSGFPHMVPFGEDTATSLVSFGSQIPSIGGLQINGTQTGLLADSTVNTGFLGMLLGTGGAGTQLTTEITGPAGSVAGDLMFWVAGKSSLGGL